MVFVFFVFLGRNTTTSWLQLTGGAAHTVPLSKYIGKSLAYLRLFFFFLLPKYYYFDKTKMSPDPLSIWDSKMVSKKCKTLLLGPHVDDSNRSS